MKGARMTIQDLKASKVADINPQLFEKVEQLKNKKSFPGQPAPQVMWMNGQLMAWGLKGNINVVREYKFHPVRKWRFDFFIQELNCAIEYEGIFSDKSRHTSKAGFTGDVEKYREAAKMGITVLRYTAKDYKKMIKDVDRIYEESQNK